MNALSVICQFKSARPDHFSPHEFLFDFSLVQSRLRGGSVSSSGAP
jgi:hypothetical protein